MPSAEILTLTENKENNTEIHYSLLDCIIGKYLK